MGKGSYTGWTAEASIKLNLFEILNSRVSGFENIVGTMGVDEIGGDDGNNVLISLSPEGDKGYAGPEIRIATMSTHVRAEEWSGLVSKEYEWKKEEYAGRMKAALDRAFPGVEGALRHIEFASPRSFARYTRRTLGRVGGPPVSRLRSNLMAVDPGVLGKGLWVVGDSVFPGQGTMAVVMCAMRVLERMTGREGL